MARWDKNQAVADNKARTGFAIMSLQNNLNQGASHDQQQRKRFHRPRVGSRRGCDRPWGCSSMGVMIIHLVIHIAVVLLIRDIFRSLR